MPSALAGRVSQGDTTARPRVQLFNKPGRTPGQVYTAKNAGPGANLNGKVTVDGEAIACWAFSTMAALADPTEKRSETLRKFNTPESITAAVREHGTAYELAAKHEAMLSDIDSNQKHFAANDQLGNLLSQFAKKLDHLSAKSKKETRERLVLMSGKHAMDLDIQCKIEDDKTSLNYGKTYFVVSYTGILDVNHHRRVFVSNPEDLKKLTLNDFMQDGRSDFAEGDGTHFVAINLNKNMNIDVSQTHFAGSKLSSDSVLAGLTATVGLNMPEVFNHAAENTSIKKYDPKSLDGIISRHKTFKMIQGETASGKYIIQNIANLNKNPKIELAAYTNLVKKNKDNLPFDGGVKLLIGKKIHNSTGEEFDALAVAVESKNPNFLRELHKSFVSLDPSPSGKKLICESAALALQEGVKNGIDAQSYRELVSILKTFSASEELIAGLHGMGDEGDTSLGFMVCHDNPAVLAAYLNEVKELRLAAPETQDPDEENSFEYNQAVLWDMLGGYNEESDVISPLQLLLQNGNITDSVKIDTFEQICNSFIPCGLTPEYAVDILKPLLEDAVSSGASKEVIDTLQDALKLHQTAASD
jgi:hypothetical protein